MVGVDSYEVSRASYYSGNPKACSGFWLRAFHPLWRSFPEASPNLCTTTSGSYNPDRQVDRFSLFRFRSPLLTESLSISFPPVTEMFHFAGCRDVPAMDSQELEQVLSRSGYRIRKSTGQSVFAAVRSLSQLTTSFIAYWHQGIHDALFVA